MQGREHHRIPVCVERRGRTIMQMREYLYELKHNELLETSIEPSERRGAECESEKGKKNIPGKYTGKETDIN